MNEVAGVLVEGVVAPVAMEGVDEVEGVAVAAEEVELFDGVEELLQSHFGGGAGDEGQVERLVNLRRGSA